MSDEQEQSPPNGTPVPMPAPVVGELCHVCVDEKRRFKAVDDVVWFTVEGGRQHTAHLACFWQMRAQALERENQAAQQALAIVLAAKGGMVTVTMRDLELWRRTFSMIGSGAEGGPPSGTAAISTATQTMRSEGFAETIFSKRGRRRLIPFSRRGVAPTAAAARNSR